MMDVTTRPIEPTNLRRLILQQCVPGPDTQARLAEFLLGDYPLAIISPNGYDSVSEALQRPDIITVRAGEVIPVESEVVVITGYDDVVDKTNVHEFMIDARNNCHPKVILVDATRLPLLIANRCILL